MPHPHSPHSHSHSRSHSHGRRGFGPRWAPWWGANNEVIVEEDCKFPYYRDKITGECKLLPAMVGLINKNNLGDASSSLPILNLIVLGGLAVGLSLYFSKK